MTAKFRETSILAGALVIVLAGLTGCGGGGTSAPIQIDGSSTVYKVSQAAAEEFSHIDPDIDISVKYAGTGGGFKSFVKGDLDICDASRPITEKEMAACKENGVEYIELPICFDALTIAVNAKNTWATDITTAELKKLWEPAADGKIMTWRQVRESWPDTKITLFGAGTDSGTFEYFTEAIVEKKNASRTDYTASENDNVILQGIEGDENALGYVPYAYFEPRQKTLKALSVDWDQDDLGPVPPNTENVVKGTYNPLSRPLFIYVNRRAAERPEVQALVEFYLTNGQKLSEDVKYIPLPAEAYPKVLDRFTKRQLGSGFGGHAVIGLPIDEILQRPPQL